MALNVKIEPLIYYFDSTWALSVYQIGFLAALFSVLACQKSVAKIILFVAF